MRLGIIARSDNTGLGNQTRELVKMLNPHRILLIDSRSFNSNEQHPEWYKDYQVIRSNGFPRGTEISAFLREVDVVLSCETFYSTNFASYANLASTANLATYATTANSVAGANVSGEVANANYASFANVAASANSVALANVVGIGNIANINFIFLLQYNIKIMLNHLFFKNKKDH